MFKIAGDRDWLLPEENAEYRNNETVQEDMMDTDPWGRVPYTRKNRMGHWKERTESYRTQRISSYREQYE